MRTGTTKKIRPLCFDKTEALSFEELPQSVRDIVKDALTQAADAKPGPEGWKSHDESLELIEHKRRDGFIPFSHNKGGYTYRNFSTLMDYWGSGHTPAHAGAAEEIERQIDYGMQCARESFFAKNTEALKGLGITEAEAVNYHELYELDHGRLAENFSEYESENLGGDDSTVMHEFRFMYHGAENGKHSASISAALNTEGPYHRSSISWAPNLFCEGAKELEITWRTDAELQRKLATALAKCSKAIF